MNTIRTYHCSFPIIYVVIHICITCLFPESKDWVYLGQPKKTANGDYAVDIMAKAGIDREIISGTYYFHIRVRVTL